MNPRSLRLTGRVLHLVDNPDLLRRQLDGEAITITPDTGYVFGVNTDAMISGGNCTLGYTRDVLGPHFLEHFQGTVNTGDIKRGGFQVVVGGDAYGSGSSREVAVVAHRGSGIELVVARSFQRIFQENMVYNGLPFTTDLNVLARLEAGEEIKLDEINADLPPFFATVATAGGLLAYAHTWLAGEATPWYDTDAPARPMTIAEKIIAANAWAGGSYYGLRSVHPGDQVLCRTGFRGMHEYTTGMVMNLYGSAFGHAPITHPEAVACFADHFVLLDHGAVPDHIKSARLASSSAMADEMFTAADAFHLRVHGPGRLKAGVCHRIVVEDYAEPDTIVALTDSHSPTAGVLNCFAFGVGSTAMAFGLRTGTLPVTVPKTVRVNVTGNAEGIVTPKDLILHLIGNPYFRKEQWRTGPTDTCIIEFGGDGLDQWSVDELSVLTNMTVEGGLMTGIVAPCRPIIEFLRQQRGHDFTNQMIYPDEGATYENVINVNLAEVPITVATPGDSRNRRSLADVGDVPIHNVVVASCTGGSLADLRAAAAVLAGRRIAKGVRLTVTPSSAQVAANANAEGLLDFFHNLGAVVTEPGCGSCIGNGPGIPRPDETTASTTNRNFDRRMGAPGPVYLVSPAVAAASAVTGRLTDPRALPPA